MIIEPFTSTFGGMNKLRSADWAMSELQHACYLATKDPEQPIEPYAEYLVTEDPVFRDLAALAVDREADAYAVAKKAKEHAQDQVPNVATFVVKGSARAAGLWLVVMDCDSNL
jgi:hypothetical protein